MAASAGTVITRMQVTDLKSRVNGEEFSYQRFSLACFSVTRDMKRVKFFGVMLLLQLIMQCDQPLLLSEVLLCKLQPLLQTQQLPLQQSSHSVYFFAVLAGLA